MKKIYFLMVSLLISGFISGQVINEIDSDTPGTDTEEFIEIKWTPNTALDGLVVVLFNGNGDISYNAFDLDGFSTDENGFFILANTAIAGTNDFDIGASNIIQNGADAVALYTGNAEDFPNGTAPTTTNLLSALVYGTADPDATGLLTGLGETVQYDESENGNSATESIQRKNDGTYETKLPTFRAENDSAVCELVLTGANATCDTVTQGVDTYTATIDFTGGGTSSYTVTASSGTVDLSAGNPSIDASGTITVTGASEGTDVTIFVVDGALCDLESSITSPSCVPALAVPIYEPFDYTIGSELIDAPNWENISDSSDEVLVGGPGGLSYTGLVDSQGNHVSFDGIGSDPAITFEPITTGLVYTSFLFAVTDQTLASDLTDGGYFAILGTNGQFRARLWVRANPSTSENTFDIGLSNSGSNPDFGSTLYTVGETIMVVMSYDTSTGNMNAWINPSQAQLESSSAPDPTISSVLSASPSTINQFIIRQDSTSETPFMLLDELRIGTSWADVTPSSLSVGDSLADGFNLYPNPATNGSVTISSNSADAMQVQVYDVLGKVVKNDILSNNTLDVSNLNTGLYIIKITQNQNSVTKKLVIK
ncbi:T9SS type A sorting domain-containing protein [Paucihalobacter ruber]|uniref:T9SS type A sorting domain-containing protein n=1 Tax=Paucihalobacter ruber TaxID=2567861 RepID=A0A506PLY9_9FLAO|nr:T9SS type A sorting domain-containing protein [Paucihalobacter ruber]TPV34624.1 T9SS type A sorting domain-containing protein [Paucihalobacter ruber]